MTAGGRTKSAGSSAISAHGEGVHGMHSGSLELGKPSGLAAKFSKASKNQNIQTQDNEGATH